MRAKRVNLTPHDDRVHPPPLLYLPLSLSSYSNRSDKNYMFACRITASWVCLPPQMITAELAKAAPPPSPQSNRGRREKLIESQTLHSPVGSSLFLCAERAECSVFMGGNQILQMTWSPLQWRWSLLVQHGAWCWMQEEQLGSSLRNRPADYLQLCWELSFLNIHIFNQLKGLSQHTCMHSCTDTHYTGKSAPCDECAVGFACKKNIYIVIMVYDYVIYEILLTIRVMLICVWAACHYLSIFSSSMHHTDWRYIWQDCECSYFIL